MKQRLSLLGSLLLALSCGYAAPATTQSDAQEAPQTAAKANWSDATFERLGFQPPSEGQEFVLLSYDVDDQGKVKGMVHVLHSTDAKLTPSAVEAATQERNRFEEAQRNDREVRKIVYFRPNEEGDFDYRIAYSLLGLATNRELADAGSAIAQNRVGEIYYHGLGDVLPEPKRAFDWFVRAADQDFGDAQYNLGVMYQMGDGVEQNAKTAVYWYQRAAEQDQANALNNLGYAYSAGFGVEKDEAKAVEYYEKAAKLGHSTSLFNLAYRYENGQGVQRDVKRAMKLYREAADKGHEGAMYCIGRLYELGQGVDRSLSEAQSWYRRASREGSTHAQQRLQQLSSRQASLN
ncbi:MAG: tetratricopeptide repeat protein [Verrucomicrobiota bacterium JB022]|nr:tetratricopeptide repeat protein [Verrucomicrobiota bacterium JB022]